MTHRLLRFCMRRQLLRTTSCTAFVSSRSHSGPPFERLKARSLPLDLRRTISGLINSPPILMDRGHAGAQGGGENPPAAREEQQLPPSIELDKDRFKRVIKVKALKVPSRECQRFLKLLSKHLLGLPRVRNILDDPEDDQSRLVLLRQGLVENAFDQCLLSRSVKDNTSMEDGRETQTLKGLVQSEQIPITDASVVLDYDHLTASEVLRQILPDDIEVPSSFETVGHIIHLNLKDPLLPYRYIIGYVLLEKNPRIRTVINKVGTIENQWRVFDMEILAGEEDTITEVRQGGLRFKLDFKRVYWNSRLEAEHNRLVHRWFRPGEIVADAMAGIGPFALPAAKLGCRVVANDLNPDSYKWLLENVKLNRVGHFVCATCLDGREFLKLVASGGLKIEAVRSAPASKANSATPRSSHTGKSSSKDVAFKGEAERAIDKGPDDRSSLTGWSDLEGQHLVYADHIVMNLPATAVEFLDALNGNFTETLWSERAMPMIHVYAFLKADETTEDLKLRIERALGGTLDSNDSIEFHPVRDVAPNKQMFCASFRVPRSIAFPEGGCNTIAGDADLKRQKLF